MKNAKFHLALFLVAFLFLTPAIVFLSEHGGILPDEKRKKADVPSLPDKIRHGSVKKLFQEFDSFFSDHFPLRGPFLQKISSFYQAVGHNFDFNRCYRGKANWLFLGNYYAQTVSKLQMDIVPTQAHIDATIKPYADLAAACEKDGVELVLVVGPNKSGIYKEYLPPVIHPSQKRYADFFLQPLEQIPGLRLCDAKEALMSAKADGALLYYRPDTHWNLRGSRVAFEGVRSILSLPPLPAHQLVNDGKRHGDDLIDIAKLKNFPVSADDAYTLTWEKPLPLAITKKDNITTVLNPESASEKTVWTLGDSFMYALQDYIYASFRKTTDFGHLDHILPNISEILKYSPEKPDVILIIGVERRF